jgi:hypothetical protein
VKHCPNCDCEVIVWDSDLEADKCIDCGESWSVDEQEAIAALPEANMEWEEITGKSPYCDYCLAILPGIHEVSCKAP